MWDITLIHLIAFPVLCPAVLLSLPSLTQMSPTRPYSLFTHKLRRYFSCIQASLQLEEDNNQIISVSVSRSRVPSRIVVVLVLFPSPLIPFLSDRTRLQSLAFHTLEGDCRRMWDLPSEAWPATVTSPGVRGIGVKQSL